MDSQSKDDSLLTPQPRGRKAYPSSLAADDKARHVPLHRRGRSKTYERLEDLLREAGYKETRIFTPEAERIEAANADRRARKESESVRRAHTPAVGSGRGFGGAMANLLGGLVRRGDESAPPSPTASKGRLREGMATSSLRKMARGQAGGDERHLSSSPSPEILHGRRPLTPLYLSADNNSPGSSGMASSSSSRSPPGTQSRKGGDARTKLRHMMSAPDMPRRKQLPLPARRSSERPKSQVMGDDQPPMPSNWLQTVTKAVLGAGLASGAYIGGPTASQRSSFRARTPRSRGRLPRDGTFQLTSSGKRNFTPYTPRAVTSPGVVSAVSVVCRSTPSSRCSSVSRSSKHGKDNQRSVPSLGVTSVEGDMWPVLSLPPNLESNAIQLDTDSDDDSDEGDMTFARLILPSKRQHSIQSLRKHLHNAASSLARPPSRNMRPTPSASNSVRRVMRTPTSPLAGDSFDDELLQQSWHQHETESTDDTADEWSQHSDLPGFSRGPTKKRGTMPWAPWGQNN